MNTKEIMVLLVRNVLLLVPFQQTVLQVAVFGKLHKRRLNSVALLKYLGTSILRRC